MKRWLPTRQRLLASRWLRPLARYLDDDRLWHFERAPVARAVGIGLFVGLLLPFGQFVFAVAAAVWLRAHVAVAAAATLISNPLTFPLLFWAAYRVGRWLLGESDDALGAERLEARADALIRQAGYFEGLWHTLSGAGLPLLTGLVAIAAITAPIGFALVWLLWRPDAADSALLGERR